MSSYPTRQDMKGKTYLPIHRDDPNEFVLIQKGSNVKVAANFTNGEFYASRIGQPHWMSRQTIALVQIVRSHYGVPVRVTSSYRNYIPTDGVKPASKSPHMMAEAADFTFAVGQKEKESLLIRTRIDFAQKGELFQKLWNAGCRGFGIYDTFIHLDTVPVELYPDFRAKRRSIYQNQKYASWNEQIVLAGRTVDSAGVIESPNPITVLGSGASNLLKSITTESQDEGLERGWAIAIAVGAMLLSGLILWAITT